MAQSSYWNIHEEHHPKNRLLKYSKSSKLSRDTLAKLQQLRKIYQKLPAIVYSYQDPLAEGQGKRKQQYRLYPFSLILSDIILEYDIFGQQCHLPLHNLRSIWRPTSFYVPDRFYERLKGDFFSSTIDYESVFLALFPIYADMNRKKQLTMGQQAEEIFLPSTIPMTQFDLHHLKIRFDQMLYDDHALEIGLCSKRRRIYNDLFDELIRIIYLQCSERGLLLARMKNEYLQWINTYEELYSSGMAYGLRETLHKSDEKHENVDRMEQLEKDCQRLHDEIDRESIRYERLTQLIVNDEEFEQNSEQRSLKNNLHILRSANEILRRDLQTTLNNILSSTIFLGEPIDYNKQID